MFRLCVKRGAAKAVMLTAFAAFFLIPFAVTAATDVSGTYITSDTAWTAAGSPYVITGALKISSGAILTIEPGVVVKFKNSPWLYSHIDVYGRLIVSGTEQEPVIFTSWLDDSVGGDTNGDGSATVPSFLDYWDLGFYSGSTGELDYLDFRYSGGGIFLDGTNVSVNHLKYSECGDKIYVSRSSINIKNSEGVNLYYGFLGAYWNSQVEISDTVISGSFGDSLGGYSGSQFLFSHVLVENQGFGSSLGLYGAHATVTDSIFNGGLDDGVEIYKSFLGGPSHIYLENSEIRDFLGDGLVSYNSFARTEKVLFFGNECGLVGNGGYIKAEGGAFEGNFYCGVLNINSAAGVIDARNNYWGDPSGPESELENPDGLGDKISAGVLFSPWLTEDPWNPSPSTPECCSSVLFLPGIKGSKLESGGDTLWPPTVWSDDVRQLALNEAGGSVYPVVVDGIVNTFYGAPVYSGFSSFMDSLVEIDPDTGTSTIREWLPLAYDWRYSPEEILENGIATTNGTVNILDKVEALAGNSYSGKVTIIAHSMGGLMGKAIIKALEDEGKENLIDAFVMVGTPQLGTPQAVGSLLHGEGEGIAGGFIVSRSESRMIGQNMKSAFNLLPSPNYFSEVTDPVIVFDDESAFTDDWRNFWGNEINTYESFESFMTGTGLARIEPAEDDLLTPEVLRESLTDYASDFHNIYDSYVFPENIRVVQIAGWGMPTVKGIKYISYHGEPSYKALMTNEGDNTVVYPSAVSHSTNEMYFINLSLYNKDNSTDFQHRNLLSVEPLQGAIERALHGSVSYETSYITVTKPPITEEENRLIVSTHSPVILGAYDGSGNFTGIDPNQDLSSDILAVTEDIPGSSFLSFGDSQYIFLPKEGLYSFIFKGLGDGQATVEIEDFADDNTTPIAIYSDISVATGTEATFDLDSLSPEITNINVDYDNDKKIDFVVYSDDYEFTLPELLALLKDQIGRSDIDGKLKEKLIKLIEKLEKSLDKLKNDNASIDKLAKLIRKTLKGGQKGDITEGDVEYIMDILGEIEGLL